VAAELLGEFVHGRSRSISDGQLLDLAIVQPFLVLLELRDCLTLGNGIHRQGFFITNSKGRALKKSPFFCVRVR
jgi:hypothetical protein